MCASTHIAACKTVSTPEPQLLQVPWGGKQVALGMVAWAASFLLVGLVVSPLVVKSAGVTVSARHLSEASVCLRLCSLTWHEHAGLPSLLESES